MSVSEQLVEAICRGAKAASDASALGEDEWIFVPQGYIQMREATYALKMVQQERRHWIDSEDKS